MNSDQMTLIIKAPILRWDDAIPLGNGLTGALIWGKKNVVNISMDRGDIWDNRPIEFYEKKETTWKTIQNLVLEKKQKVLSNLFDVPYNQTPYPTKLPVGRIQLIFDRKMIISQFSLNMKTGEATISFANTPAKLLLFFHQEHPLLLLQSEISIQKIKIKGPGEKREKKGSHSPLSFKSLEYKKFHATKSKKSCGFQQQTAIDGNYALYGEFSNLNHGSIAGIAVAYEKSSKNSLEEASVMVKQFTSKSLDIEPVLQQAREWWEKFWGTSKISIPDSKILLHYNLTQYFYGAASRKGAPPMPLQGVWTADTENLPPWKGDYHFDLNVQVTYWACLNTGRFAAAESLLDFMWDLIPEHQKFAESFFEAKEGIAVPGVMTLTGQPMGGWVMYSLSPVQGIWLAQHFYWQWSYTQDREFLTTRGYPYLKKIAQPIMHLLEQKADGFYYLPLSSSPEIHDNSLKAWLQPNSTYDLSLMKWLFAALEKTARELNLLDDLSLWEKFSQGLAPLAVDPSVGLKISSNENLPESHRHFSHLMAIYPLQLLDVDNIDDRQIMEDSLANIEQLGTKHWVGYSFSWMACIYAQILDGERAFDYLSKFVNAFVTRNYFHVNGDQSGNGYSNFTYRPFTLEGNFAAAQALHEMLIQSIKNKIRIFPAVPSIWKNIAFEDLIVQGGHKISAKMDNGHITFVHLTAERNGIVLVSNSFTEMPTLTIDGITTEIIMDGDYIQLDLKKGSIIKLENGT